MSLEVKLGGLNMGLFGRKKKNKDEHFGNEMSRREFLKKTGIAVAGAYLGANVFSEALAGGNPAKIPWAIMADPSTIVKDAYHYGFLGNTRHMGPPYNCTNREMARRMLGFSDGPVVGLKTIRSDEAALKTSHAYYLLAAKLNRCSDFLIEKNLKENVSLNMFANGLKNMFGMTSHDRNNYRAAEFFAKGIFTAGMYDKSNSEAFGKASEFMESDVRGKELMLREIYESNFKKFNAMPKVRDVNTVEYKMLSFYWNLGFYILTDYNRGNKDEALSLRNTKGNTYTSIGKKYGFNSADGNLL